MSEADDVLPDLCIYIFRLCDEATEDWKYAYEISFNQLRLSALKDGYETIDDLIDAIIACVNKMLHQDDWATFVFNRDLCPHSRREPRYVEKRFAKLMRSDFAAAVELFKERSNKHNGAKD